MEYKIKTTSFELKDVFECGQCFRWNKEEDGSYTGVIHNIVLNVNKCGEEITFKCIGKAEVEDKSQAEKISEIKEISEVEKISENKVISQAEKNLENEEKEFEDLISNYFDLKRNYEDIKDKLSKIDDNLKIAVQYGSGIRILNQDLWEMIISFIISANNNIPRIKGIIERMSKKYGNEIVTTNGCYYTFPTPEQLSNANVQDLRDLGLGFRDIRIYETTKLVLERKVDLKELHNMNTEDARNMLLTLSGVGPKVADCILLFSTLKRFDVFPIDVWVRRVMNDLYIHNPIEEKVDKKEIKKLADAKFGSIEGLAQQYLFYWKREN